MPHYRYYLDSAFYPGSFSSLSGEEWHHLFRVLRCQKGDFVELVNGRGQLAKASIEEVKKEGGVLQIEEVIEKLAPPALILAQALPRMNHLEWIIEKGTELNATAFWLFPGELSEKTTLSENQLERLKHLSISAMKQCGRLHLPSIHLKPPLMQWLPLKGTLLYGSTEENAPPLWEISLPRPFQEPVIFFIGPEKGFDDREAVFMAQALGAKGVSLHSNTLRAETAPLVALSLMQPFL